MPEVDKLSFVVEHLQGEIKLEIQCRPKLEVNSYKKVLDIISEVYGTTANVSELQEQFYQRKQKANETVHDYSLSILKLFEGITKVCPSMKSDQDKLLKGKFQEGVRDEFLKREIRRLNLDKPNLTFWQLRDRVKQWYGNQQCSVSSEQHSTTVSGHPSVANQLADLQKLVDSQRLQLTNLQSQMRRPNYRGRPRGYRGYTGGRGYGHFQGQTGQNQAQDQNLRGVSNRSRPGRFRYRGGPSRGHFSQGNAVAGDTAAKSQDGTDTLYCNYCSGPNHFERFCLKKREDVRVQSEAASVQVNEGATDLNLDANPFVPSYETGTESSQAQSLN